MNTYYYPETIDNFITQYNESSDESERNTLYNNHIHVHLTKLVEYMVNKSLGNLTYALQYLTVDEIKAQLLTHCVINLPKYKVESGKSFSYFTVACYNWLLGVNMEYHAKTRVECAIIAPGATEDENEVYMPLPRELSVIPAVEMTHPLSDYLDLLVNRIRDNPELILRKQQYKQGPILEKVLKSMEPDGVQAYHELFRYRKTKTERKTHNGRRSYLKLLGLSKSKNFALCNIIARIHVIHKELYPNYLSTGSLDPAPEAPGLRQAQDEVEKR